MRTGFLIQTSASVIVLSSLLAADAVAYLLHLMPSSTLLWYLAIEVFRPFDPFGDPFQTVVRSWLTPGVVAALLVATVLAHWLRVRVVIGLFANVSSIFMVALAWRWAVPHRSMTASLAPTAGASGVDVYFVSALCVLSIVSAVASHYLFLTRRHDSSSIRSVIAAP